MLICKFVVRYNKQSLLHYRQQKQMKAKNKRFGKKHIPPCPVDAQNSAIPGAIPPKIGEDLSEMWPNCHTKFHTDWSRPG